MSVSPHKEDFVVKVDSFRIGLDQLHAEKVQLPPEEIHEVNAFDTSRKSRIVLDKVCIAKQSPQFVSFEQNRFSPSPVKVYGTGDSRRPRSDNNHLRFPIHEITSDAVTGMANPAVRVFRLDR